MVISDALSLIPWTRWLTWLLQVMPIFFLVGGYVNGLGWQSAQQRQEGYAAWLTGRLHRLINPVLPVLAVWTLFGLGAVLFDADRALLKIASQFALLPAWFLVVYILVVLLVPLAHRAWQRYGFASFWALAAAAVLVDLLALGVGWRILGWLNYLFVWLAVHQLGFAWQAGRMAAAAPLSALGRRRDDRADRAGDARPLSDQHGNGGRRGDQQQPASQSDPAGVGRLPERPAAGARKAGAAPPRTRRPLDRHRTDQRHHHDDLPLARHHPAAGIRPGTADRRRAGFLPGTAAWWLTRPLWIAALAVALIPFVVFFTRFERIGMAPRRAAPPAWLLLLGCGLFCFGLATLTLRGIPTESWPGINLLALGLPFIGAALVRYGAGRA